MSKITNPKIGQKQNQAMGKLAIIRPNLSQNQTDQNIAKNILSLNIGNV